MASTRPEALLAAAPASSVTRSSDDEEVTTAEFSIDLTDSQTWAINFYECAAEGDLECLEEILDSGHVGVNDVDVDGFTALMVAAAEGHVDVVRALLRRGAEVSMRTYELRSSALHFAAKNGDADVMTALCSCDATVVDCWNIHADTPLIWACIEGRVEAVKVLLAHGADVSAVNQYGASTVLCAVMIGEDLEQEHELDERRAEILTMLLEKNGKLVNFQDREGSSAMHLAASCGYLACVKTLLAFGAEITLRNAVGLTPLEEAQDSELPGSSACVEHLRGIWRQLEEEATVRMMAMLEVEEDAASGAAGTASNKKSKKKNKKGKRKMAVKQQQQHVKQQEVEQDRIYAENMTAQQRESHDSIDNAATSERVVEDISAGRDCDNTAVDVSTTEAKEDETSFVSSEDAPIGIPVVVVGLQNGLDHEDHAVLDRVSLLTDTLDEQSGQATKRDPLPSTSAWTTVGKKHRSAVAAIATASLKASTSPMREKTLSTFARRRSSAATVCSKPSPHTSRRRFTQRSGDARERSSSSGSILSAQGQSPVKPADAVRHPSSQTQAEKWGKWSGVARASQSVAPSSQLNPDAPSFGSLGPTTGPMKTSSMSAASSSSGLSIPSTPQRRPSFGFSHAPHTITSTTGTHYSPAGRLTWKQHRSSSVYQMAHATRDRWISKLQPGNERVAETLGYLACGLCGELVSDNLQCSGSASKDADEKTSTCTQLYCAACLECSALQKANAVTFKCIKCHEVITKESMTRNSLAQAQAASLGLSVSTGINTGAQGDAAASYTLENMQQTLELSGPRISPVDLRAFFLVPGTELSTLSNGQLEVLEHAHQLALGQIVDQRLANARALERLQMEEWLKIRRDLLHFAPR